MFAEWLDRARVRGGGSDLCDVNEVDHRKILDGICNAREHLIHLHANWVGIVSKSCNHDSVLLLHGKACVTIGLSALISQSQADSQNTLQRITHLHDRPIYSIACMQMRKQVTHIRGSCAPLAGPKRENSASTVPTCVGFNTNLLHQ